MQKLTAILVATFLSLGVAVGDDKDKDTSKTSADATFKSLDRDADQRLSKTEAADDKMLTDHFAAVDGDSDGYLTKREYTAHLKEMKSAAPKKDY